MKQFPNNPRLWTDEDRAKLKANLQELGDISGIVHDENSDSIPCGNFRSDTININKCEIEIVKEFDEPDAQGTVALGYVIWEGNRYNYRRVQWTAEQCEKACITANALGGDWDYEELMSGNWDKKLLEHCNIELPESMEELLKGEQAGYTRKIESPIYEPSETMPELHELYDTTKTQELINEINSTDIPEDVKAFLLLAAQRHVVFNYEKIADYYSHADEKVKGLMAQSALVIIDFHRAIKQGYVKLSEEITAQYLEEYGE